MFKVSIWVTFSVTNMIKLILSCLNASFKKLIVGLQVHPKLIASDYINTGRSLGRTKAVHSCVTPQGAWSGGSEAWLPNPSSLTYFNRNGRVRGLGKTSWYVCPSDINCHMFVLTNKYLLNHMQLNPTGLCLACYFKPSMVQKMGCRRAGDNPIIWTNDGTVSWHIYCEIRPRWVKGRWPRRSSWRHIGFSDYVAIVFVFTVYCVLGTSLLLWIYAPIYSYYCPYKHYLLPMCFKCLYILPLYILYILCIYTFMYWKSGTSDLLVLMFFVLQCTDYK